MEKMIKILMLLLLSSFAFTACEDDDNNDATPSILYVRVTDAAASDSLIVSASMGETIALIGSNLGNVVSMYFNDVAAKLNPNYVTSSSIVVTIPGTMPDDISNTITLTTSAGRTLVYDFVTKITAPDISSLSCEFANDGSEITINGSYFFPNSENTIDVLFPGNLSAEVIALYQDSIIVTVPNGTMTGYVTVTNDYGTTKSPYMFRDETGIFIDAENNAEWNLWGLSDFASEGGIDGTYINFEGSTGSWAWPANSIQLGYFNPDGTSLVAEGEVADYALKFEYYCHEWHDTPLLIWFDNTSAHNVDGEEAQYHWTPYDTDGVSENYVTEGWVTITMPLSDFVYSKDETEDDRAIASLNELQNLNMMWFGAVNDNTTEFGLKIWMDNIRLVKIVE
jgi:hypothetical protein